MANNDVYQILKSITLEDVVNIIVNSNKSKDISGDNNCEILQSDNKKTIYTIDELINNYPFFTRYNINKAIQRDGLPFMTIGNKRMFNKEEIEKWLEKESKPKKEKNKYDI